MTDRELLELAARHAGRAFTLGRDWHDVGQIYVDGRAWDALADDGDALRLAVACRLTVCTDGDATVSACEAHRPETGAFATQSVSECADKFAATRRAIVRAAAQMAA